MIRRRFMLIIAAVALVTFGFALGVTTVGSSPVSPSFSAAIRALRPAAATSDLQVLDSVWSTMHRTYVNRNIDDHALIQGMISGLVKGLNDPYSVYFAPSEAKNFQDEVEGVFQGIGAEIGFKNQQLAIIAPLPDSPAAKAGLRSGDIILSIDGKSTDGLSLDEAVGKIRGPQGTTVKLLIQHANEKDTTALTIIRQTIKVNSVRTERLTVDQRPVAHITITSFSLDTGKNIAAAVRQAVDDHVQGIILDLRNNPGGYLEQSITASSVFLADGVVVRQVDRNGHEREERVTGNALWPTQPLVVLVDGGSASASEIMAGALQDHHRALIIGAQTFGKGSVQDYEQLPDGSSLKLTVAKWLTPNGRSISDHGITPDRAVALTQDDVTHDRDPQLEAAKSALFAK